MIEPEARARKVYFYVPYMQLWIRRKAAATKGAIVAFTRSLAKALIKRGIRVNAVAPGPVWTPLIPSTFPPDQVARFGTDVPMERAGEPMEIAPCYVFLAASDSNYITGQVLHPNGGEVVNG